MAKPRTSFDFVTQAPGTYLLETKSVEFSHKEDSGDLMCRVVNTVLDSIDAGSEFNNTPLSEMFNLEYAFAVDRLLGLLAVGVDLPNKEYPDDYFTDEKVQERVKKQLAGAKFGAKIKHTPDKADPNKKYINVVEYYTQKEYQELMKKSNSTSGGAKKVEEKAGAGAEAGAGTGSGW